MSYHWPRVARHLRRNAIAYLALFVALGGTSFAATQGFVGSDGAVHACAAAKSGAVRLVRQGKKCRRAETAVAWAQLGPRGATGAAGQPGAPGPAGQNGQPGQNGLPGAPATKYFASVSDTAATRTGTATAAARDSTGKYDVTFGTADISNCSALVTPGGNATTGGTTNAGATYAVYPGQTWSSGSLSTDTHSVAVEIFRAVGEGTTVNNIDTGFHVAVFC
jgi:hypothetical protein